MRDLRNYAKQTNVRLAVGAFFLLFGVGLALIWVFYGEAAAGMGLLCLLAALLPVVLILAFFGVIDWILKRARPE
ncbi:MAG: hypothetical protein EHM33_25985 [Chloroflexi bacterium]|nr:MAG: hypothetical protein EHM33_25985 [Chloroflexota bacterium]